jgi:hypothetical protein
MNGFPNKSKCNGCRWTVPQHGKEWHWKRCLEPENEDGNSDGKRVPFCAYEFPMRQLQTVDSKLASPTGFEPVGLQNGPLISKHLGHANHLI